MEMERDALLHEITRMQKDVKGLKAVQNALKCEHQELCQIKHKADELAVLNFELENCMDGVNKDLERTNQDVIIFRQKMTESSIEARKNAKQFKELEEHTEALKRLLADERSERRGLDKELAGLELQLKKAEKELTAKGLKKPASPKPKPKPREKIWEVTSPGKGGTSPRSPRKDQDGKLDTPKSKGGKPGGKGGDAAAAAAAAASAASFKAKNTSARLFGALSKTEPRPGGAALEDRAGGTFKKQASKASGTDSRQTSPESFRKKTFKEGTAAFESQETMRKKAEALQQKSLKEAEALKQKSLKETEALEQKSLKEPEVLKQKSLKAVALSKASERPQSTDALKKEASKAARPKAAEPTSRSTSPSATPGKAEKASAGKSKDKAADKKTEPGQGGKRGAGLKEETKGTKDEAKGTKGDVLQAQKERQRLETELAAKMEKQKREMELAAKQREMELAARLEKQQKEMELAAKQREMEFLAKQRELEAAAAKQREMEAVAAAAAAKQREMELAAAAKQREMAELAAAKGLKLKAESRDEACQTSETADSYDELMRKMRKLEDELASHRSRESSPGPSSTPPPSRAFTKKLTIKVDDKQMDRKLTKKATVKKPDVAPATPGTPRKSKVASTPATPKEPERKPEPPKPEPKKPEPVPITVPVPEPEPVRKYPARQIRRQILMADQDFAEDTKQITGPADAPRPRSVMFESSSFNVLLAEPSTDPLIETQAPNE
ncbi:titin homolog [Selaginella moellendorffii]|uniref:titin homolog n=1 Tax=Selaginella moellendorffii TaxID=88036 RepID=UPI000D1CF4F4|nr:titin homolog [Selaginella moellendorffii]|eukprot:XP_024537984.1 titin homolog [Selaginella moellendorffii]